MESPSSPSSAEPHPSNYRQFLTHGGPPFHSLSSFWCDSNRHWVIPILNSDLFLSGQQYILGFFPSITGSTGELQSRASSVRGQGNKWPPRYPVFLCCHCSLNGTFVCLIFRDGVLGTQSWSSRGDFVVTVSRVL